MLVSLIASAFSTVPEHGQKPVFNGEKHGARFKDAHLRARPIVKLKRDKKTGYIVCHGA